MPSPTGSVQAAETPLRPLTLGSALKRAALGIVILAVAMGGVAWLTYASIDQDLDRGAAPAPVKATQSLADREIRL